MIELSELKDYSIPCRVTYYFRIVSSTTRLPQLETDRRLHDDEYYCALLEEFGILHIQIILAVNFMGYHRNFDKTRYCFLHKSYLTSGPRPKSQEEIELCRHSTSKQIFRQQRRLGFPIFEFVLKDILDYVMTFQYHKRK